MRPMRGCCWPSLSSVAFAIVDISCRSPFLSFPFAVVPLCCRSPLLSFPFLVMCPWLSCPFLSMTMDGVEFKTDRISAMDSKVVDAVSLDRLRPTNGLGTSYPLSYCIYNASFPSLIKHWCSCYRAPLEIGRAHV